MQGKVRLSLGLVASFSFVGCRLLTGTGDLVIDDGASGGGSASDGSTSGNATSSNGSGGAGGQGTSTSSGTSGSTTTTGAGGGVATCAEYCNALGAQCTGQSLQYDSMTNCLDYCAYLSESADPNADTLACRAKFLPPHNLDCVAAGPGGAGQCGDPCQNFCIRALFICPGVYIDLDDCTSFCATLPDTSLASYAAPANLDNTLTCRLYYLTREVSSPTVFCASLGQDSNNCL